MRLNIRYRLRKLKQSYRYYRKLLSLIRYDFRRWVRYERNGLRADRDGKATLSYLAEFQHSIERAITLPEMRQGFGQERLSTVMDMVDGYLERFPGPEPIEIRKALEVVAEYKELHDSLGYTFPESFAKRLQTFLEMHPCTPSHQPEVTRAQYWADSSAPFDVFCRSRHSVRAFQTGAHVPMETVRAAVRLAHETAPTACNRRQVRIHIVGTPDLVAAVCKLQPGNNGFGHTIDKLLVVTGAISYESLEERHDLYTNCGIMVMNLCYALQFHKVAHCCLNWSVPTWRDGKLRELLSLPDDEEVALMIAIGVEKEHFRITLSPKRDDEEVVTVH